MALSHCQTEHVTNLNDLTMPRRVILELNIGILPASEIASIEPATRTQNARVQEPGVSPKISLNPRHDLQHIQRPTPPHLGKKAPNLPGLDDADMARRRHRGVISVTRNFPHQISINVTKPRIVMRARTSHHAVLPPLGLAKVPALRVCGNSRFAKYRYHGLRRENDTA